MTAPGTRRPREGRCERCDRPLTDEVYEQWVSAWPHADPPAVPPPAVFGWSEQESNETHCIGGLFCISDPPDWKARAKEAEESVVVCKAMISQLVGDLESMNRGLFDQYQRGYTNGHAAGRQAAYDGEEPKGYGQALRDMTARALAAESVAARDWTDAARHGLLAAAWVCPECDCSDSWTLRGRHSTECAAWVRDEIAALADNGPPMAACADCDGFGGFSVYGKPSGTIVRPCETCDGEGWLAQEADRDD